MVHGQAPEAVGPSSRREMDAAVGELRQSSRIWAEIPAADKADLLARLLVDLHGVADPWAEAAAHNKGVGTDTAAGGEEWISVAFLLRAVATLQASLREIAGGKAPRIPGRIRPCSDRQLGVGVFPGSLEDRLFFPGMSTEIWTEPGVTRREILAGQAGLYREAAPVGKVAFVLGAGNVTTLGPCDVLDKLFCDGAVVIYKPHPVLDYLTPWLERAFAALIERGFLRIVRGGAEEGDYLACHEGVDELHLTGSHRTYDAIVFGTGPEGERRRRAGERRVSKRFTCELGNVSPVIVVPGPWTEADLAYQAEHLAGMLTVNAGFNCLTTRLIIQHAGWGHRDRLLEGIRRVFGRTPTRPAFYPGAREIHRRFVEAHPEAERIGEARDGCLPWTLIAGVDPGDKRDICFTTEGFCSLFAETELEAADVAEFLDRAVSFANEVLWGSLTATILVHPRSRRQPEVAAAVERAIRDLRYGTVGVNLWGVLNYLTMTGSWGAYPGHPVTDIQSGHGWVHNYLMIPRVQKTVIRGPFRQWPSPLVFPSHRTLAEMGRRLVDFEASPSLWRLPGLVVTAARA